MLPRFRVLPSQELAGFTTRSLTIFHVCTGWRLDVLQLRMGEWRADWQLPVVEQETAPLSRTVKITSRKSSMLVVGGQDEIVRTQSITLL